MKGREEAAALLLLTSEQGLESLSRLKPNCGCWALSAESGGSQLLASEPRRRGMRGTLGWLRPGKVAFGSAVAGPCCGAASLTGCARHGQRKNFHFPTWAFGFVCPPCAAPESADPTWILNRWPSKSI